MTTGGDSGARAHLVARIRALEDDPAMTKTGIKSAILGDRSVDWRSLRAERDAGCVDGVPRPVNWKTELISSLLTRPFPHGGARRGGRRRRVAAAAPTNAEEAPPQTEDGDLDAPAQLGPLLDALAHCLELLPPAARRAVLRRCGGDVIPATPAAPPPPAKAVDVVPASPRLPHLLTRRHIERWRGMQCFTVRILRRMGLTLHRQAEEEAVRHGCASVHRWWTDEGRFLAHFRLRAGNRLTARLTLVYTNLPEEHPILDHVWRRVVSPLTSSAAAPVPPPPPKSWLLSTRATAASGRATVVVQPPSDPECLWLRFIRRFPVLALYRPVWDPRPQRQAVDDDDDIERSAQGWWPDWPSAGPGLRLVAACLGHDDGRPASVSEAAVLLQGFGRHAPAVVEAVRLAQRNRPPAPVEP